MAGCSVSAFMIYDFIVRDIKSIPVSTVTVNVWAWFLHVGPSCYVSFPSTKHVIQWGVFLLDVKRAWRERMSQSQVKVSSEPTLKPQASQAILSASINRIMGAL